MTALPKADNGPSILALIVTGSSRLPSLRYRHRFDNNLKVIQLIIGRLRCVSILMQLPHETFRLLQVSILCRDELVR